MKKFDVKIIAIAKDEAAYLSEWVFHHLYFGFTSIDIYLNGTSDNSVELLSSISANFPVSYFNADRIFKKAPESFQTTVYKHAFKKALSNGCDFVLYLDIDEFWTPACFDKNINTFLNQIKHPENSVISFEWATKINEDSPFLRPFQTQNNVLKSDHVKSLVSTKIKVREFHEHNIKSNNSNYLLADSSRFFSPCPRMSLVDSNHVAGPLKEFFILHRLYRSQNEYISLLARGRASQPGKLKTNRNGYIQESTDLARAFSISPLLLHNYLNKYEDFLQTSNVLHLINNARRFIIDRYYNSLIMLSEASIDQPDEVLRLIRGVNTVDIHSLREQIIRRSLGVFPDYSNRKEQLSLTVRQFEALRDVAFSLQRSNIRLSLKILLILKQLRPNGKLINSKIDELESKIKSDKI
ncbi:hypothetical protein C4K68_25395 [Pokkaliibacter plantistimulans]|uniref:Glycosyltransferase family 2 protein n=1 Tax=Proteobacteria bacterium 228 TaxID=2083153 RepID=A0A2S5KIK2_9PROT|nr:glycosyltransferase family 2 protein [Pokkaliibacter plantistimulans]PPC74651.1 hypothetical protein C4K68_25395 [Pokkaliibacter plantistimulans]